MNRRHATRLIVLGAPALMTAACENVTSPTATVAKAMLIAPTGKYKFEVIANENFASVREALQAAGLTLNAETKSNWSLVSGNKFTGSLIRGIQPQGGEMIAAHWRIDINGSYPCADVDHLPVPRGSRVQCFPDDGTTVANACAAT